MEVDTAIAISTVAIGIGGFTIARRTMESVGTELSDIPLLADLIVMLTAATITTALPWIGIPVTLVMAMVMTIFGLGWGRATRPIKVRDVPDVVQGDVTPEIEPGALTANPNTPVRRIGEDEPREVRETGDLFNPQAVIKYVSMWITGPTVSLGLSYAFFVVLPFVG